MPDNELIRDNNNSDNELARKPNNIKIRVPAY